ncbi:cytochrome o ubiquinol oxidase subunit IV [Burkholderia sp. JPY481]|uniref:Cytochrome bo(3) ubiquinol oxidase subunit 4 n=1 Tax=Paraburkholderia atlantica TaxID=2654982 RepID=A0A6I1QEF0_PARAM|nr:cytochrome o ubiquinol oxidase subunit IV [Paraburkholderia atlantica]MBB5419351.1 cytochrome o ubiquinol oxidase operon protein cyoD [Paraburkholderia atlantica]MBB5421867.1 cytochrome o ubiquinol oxidase operon protein cyoD [Paraburkholderia atlantica]MPW11422.1 cytochrome o ubiquinol oxidase subunit IV [Paraburkholderia atlantica]
MDHSHSAHGAHSEGGHGSFGSYMTGFVLSVILTVAAFAIVMTGTLTGQSALFAIAGLAVVQILVHLVFFLHMNASSSQRWNVTAFVFTALTAVIVVGGTLWVMHNVSMNMMSR